MATIQKGSAVRTTKGIPAKSKLTPREFRWIRTIARIEGPTGALRYFRSVHNSDYLVAKMALGDILSNQRWTSPRMQPLESEVREILRQRRLDAQDRSNPNRADETRVQVRRLG